MKILWISPQGEGVLLAERLRDSGHTVIIYGEAVGFPLVKQANLYQFAKASDLLVVDGNFPLVRTRRSWRPHQDALFLDELRRAYHIKALGTTPTIDLLIGDPRYLRKWCERLTIPYTKDEIVGESWTSGGWFRANDIIPNGPYLAAWKPLFKSVGFRGWFEMSGVMSQDGPIVTGASGGWPSETIPEGQEADFLNRMAQ